MDTIGKRLKYAKDKKGLTNKELAALMGKNSPSTVIAWENDTTEITVSQLKLLAEILEVSEQFLLNGNEAQSIVSEPTPDYVLVKKDEYMALQDRVIQYQQKEIEELKKSEQNLKNIEVVRTEV